MKVNITFGSKAQVQFFREGSNDPDFDKIILQTKGFDPLHPSDFNAITFNWEEYSRSRK